MTDGESRFTSDAKDAPASLDPPPELRYTTESAIRERILEAEMPSPTYVREGGLPPGSLFLNERGAMLVLWKMHWDRHDPTSACIRVDGLADGGAIEYTLTDDLTVCAAKTYYGSSEVQELSLLTFVEMLMHANAREPTSLAGRVRGRLHKHRAADSGSTNVEPLADRPNAQSLYQEHLRSVRAGVLDDPSESTKTLPLELSKTLDDLRAVVLLPDATQAFASAPSQN